MKKVLEHITGIDIYNNDLNLFKRSSYIQYARLKNNKKCTVHYQRNSIQNNQNPEGFYLKISHTPWKYYKE